MNINKDKGVNWKLRKSIKDLEEGKIMSSWKEIYFNTKNLSPSPTKKIDELRSKSTRQLRHFDNYEPFIET